MNMEFTQQALENQEAIILVLQKKLKTALGTGNTMPPEYAVIISKVLLAVLERYAYLRLKEGNPNEESPLNTNG